MLNSVSNRKSLLACLADYPTDNHPRQLALFLYGTLAATYMKNINYILFGLLILTSCNDGQKSNSPQQDRTEVSELNNVEFSFNIKDLDAEDFKIVRTQDTTYYLGHSYSGIDGKNIKYNQEDVADIRAKIKYELSFNQYTIDDNPAYPISYTKQTDWTNLRFTKGNIPIPDMYGNSDKVRVHKQLGYPELSELHNYIEKEDFERIREESYKEQLDFYKNVIKEKSLYADCCPEYVNQANEFLKTEISDYKSFDDLSLEPIYKSFTVLITGKLRNGKEFREVIINK